MRFFLFLVLTSFACFATGDDLSTKQPTKRCSNAKSVLSNTQRPTLKKIKSLAQLSPKKDFQHVMDLIEHNGTVLTPRHITPVTSQMSGNNKNTLLHQAALFGQHSLIKILVMNKADTNQKNQDGNNSLHLAILNNYILFARMLMQLGDKKPDVNMQNNVGDTALHIATRNGNAQAVKLLLHTDADPTIKNNAGETAKSIAKKLKKKYPQFNKINFEKTTLSNELKKLNELKNTFQDLLFAIQSNKIKYVKKNIKKIPINWSDNSGNTLLHIATSLKRYDIMELLLRNGADPNTINNLGENALHRLLTTLPSDETDNKQCIRSIQLLLNYDTDLTAATNLNMTALELAKIHKNQMITSFLEDKIELIQQPIKLRNTPDQTKK